MLDAWADRRGDAGAVHAAAPDAVLRRRLGRGREAGGPARPALPAAGRRSRAEGGLRGGVPGAGSRARPHPARTVRAGQRLLRRRPGRLLGAYGHHLLADAQGYAAWRAADTSSYVRDDSSTVEEMRAAGVYVVLTADDLVERCRAGEIRLVTSHPACGGLPAEPSWESLRLISETVHAGGAEARRHDRPQRRPSRAGRHPAPHAPALRARRLARSVVLGGALPGLLRRRAATGSRPSTCAATARPRAGAVPHRSGCATTSTTSPRSPAPSTRHPSSSVTRWAAWSSSSTWRTTRRRAACSSPRSAARGHRHHVEDRPATPADVPPHERDLVPLPGRRRSRSDARALLFSDLLDEVTALGYVARVQDESYLAFLDMLVLDGRGPAG